MFGGDFNLCQLALSYFRLLFPPHSFVQLQLGLSLMLAAPCSSSLDARWVSQGGARAPPAPWMLWIILTLAAYFFCLFFGGGGWKMFHSQICCLLMGWLWCPWPGEEPRGELVERETPAAAFFSSVQSIKKKRAEAAHLSLPNWFMLVHVHKAVVKKRTGPRCLSLTLNDGSK